MRYRALIFSAVMVFFIGGCAGFEAGKKPLQEENRDVLELKKAISEINLRLEELNNKFLLLQEEVENRVKAEARSEEPQSAPPPGLKVVKLEERMEGEERTEEKKASPSPEALYNRGQNLFISGKYQEARKVFSEFVDMFPASPLADNALYWIGESFYSEQNFKEAALNFKKVFERYPDENKAPDAMLKAGFSYTELGEAEKGVQTLKDLLNRYPQSEAADKAKKRLAQLSK
ncbi:MAG: tol-pal system protein YbgF [Deltaproteobacteria bacterium]|nr:tol-pal system protein YbgF [Deltaproteobacteria bacterium]